VFLAKPTSGKGLGTGLRIGLTIVAVLFLLLWALAVLANLIIQDRDLVAPEWIQACFGIYLFTYILIFGFRPPVKMSKEQLLSSVQGIADKAK
jgi:protein-S-isoprenylcysteine O-methyltransferase Ste14